MHVSSYPESGRKRPDFFCFALLLGSLAFMPLALPSGKADAQVLTTTSSTSAQLPRITLRINDQTLVAEVAATEAARSRGLMFRESLAPGHGMLFVYPYDERLCFWMKNTPLHLTVAFIDAKGLIVGTADMQPMSLEAHCAPSPVRYALEMPQGWFALRNLGVGDKVSGLP